MARRRLVRQPRGSKVASAAAAARPDVGISHLPPGTRRALLARPMRNEGSVAWEHRSDGTIVLRHAKNLRPFERTLQRYLGGPSEIRIPLDRPGSAIWELADGHHTVLDICTTLAARFGDELEPAAPRVIRFLELLLRRNLLLLQPALAPSGGTRGPRPAAGATGTKR